MDALSEQNTVPKLNVDDVHADILLLLRMKEKRSVLNRIEKFAFECVVLLADPAALFPQNGAAPESFADASGNAWLPQDTRYVWKGGDSKHESQAGSQHPA